MHSCGGLGSVLHTSLAHEGIAAANTSFRSRSTRARPGAVGSAVLFNHLSLRPLPESASPTSRTTFPVWSASPGEQFFDRSRAGTRPLAQSAYLMRIARCGSVQDDGLHFGGQIASLLLFVALANPIPAPDLPWCSGQESLPHATVPVPPGHRSLLQQFRGRLTSCSPIWTASRDDAAPAMMSALSSRLRL